ncbi:MAG: DUF1616 domain-containing protein [Candidatus Bathyarchaeia archaeon]
MIGNSKFKDLTETILGVIREKKPQSVKQLTTMLKETLNLPEREILDAILKLQAQGIIKLEDQGLKSRSFAPFATGELLWYWLTIAAGALTTILVFTVPENLYPMIYVRNFFGLVFVLFLPGFAFVKALYPANLPGKISSESIETIERIALSVGLSIALVSIVGLLLYYSPWDLSLPATVISLFVFTSICATAGMFRSTKKTSTHVVSIINA